MTIVVQQWQPSQIFRRINAYELIVVERFTKRSTTISIREICYDMQSHFYLQFRNAVGDQLLRGRN